MRARFARVGSVITIAALAACGDGSPASTPLPGPPVTLPIVAAATPMPTGPTVVTIVLSTTQGASVDGRPVATLSELRRALEERARPPSSREPDGVFKFDVVIAADDDLPFRVVQWTMEAAADERVQAYRVQFAVRHRASGERGVLPAPMAGMRRHFHLQPIEAAPALRISLLTREDAQATSPESVYAEITKRRASAPDLTVSIETPPPLGNHVRHGMVMRLLDAVRQAGVRTVYFQGAAAPRPRRKAGETEPDFRTLIAELAAESAEVASVAVGGQALGRDAATIPLPDGPPPSDQPGPLGADAFDLESPAPPEEELPSTSPPQREGGK